MKHASARRLHLPDFTGPVCTLPNLEQHLFFEKYFAYTSARSHDWTRVTSSHNRYAVAHILRNLGQISILMKTEQHMKDYEAQSLKVLRFTYDNITICMLEG